MQINPVLVSSVFLILSLLVLVKGDEHSADPIALFNSTILLALGSLFYLKIIWFVPFLWITALIIRPLTWRGIVNPILVLFLMGLFHGTYYWVFRDDLSLFYKLLSENLSVFHKEFSTFELPVWILFGYLFLLISIASFYLLSRFQARKIIIRKLYQVFFFLFIYTLLFYIFISEYNREVIVLLAIPISYLFSHYFHRRKNHWTHELMLWIWLGLILYVQISSLL